MANYPIKDELNDILVEIYPNEKYDIIINLFDTIDALNKVTLNDNYSDLDDFQDAMLEVLHNSDDETMYPIAVDLIILTWLTEYLEDYGIYFKSETPLRIYTLSTLIETILNLYTVDKEHIEEYIDYVDNNVELDNKDKILRICSNLTDLSPSDVIDLVEYVDDKFYSNLLNFYTKEQEALTGDIDKNVVNIVDKLTSLNLDLEKTYIVKYISKYGYTPTTFDNLKDDLYKRIQNTKVLSLRAIAAEIAVTLYLATDTSKKDIELTDDLINLNWVNDLYPIENGIAPSLMVVKYYKDIISIINERM